MSQRGDEGAGGDEDGQKDPEQLFTIGEIVRRWEITARIGGGAFGETYLALDTAPDMHRQEVCIKAEKQDKRPILRTEVLALKRAQDCPNVVRYVSSGKHNGVNFLVMEKLGDNLADVRRRASSKGIMDLYSALQYTIACLNCIEQVHSAGLVHRDIKPSNFVLGPPGSPPYTVYIIDFGLAKRYVSSSGEIKPPRDNAGFRGTSRYASIASHQQRDLGRVDDLWSLLFMSIEFITGTLPWRKVKEKEAIGALKEKHVGPQLVWYLPREMTDFITHLMRLDYADRPDYAMLRQLLYTTVARKNLQPPSSVQAAMPGWVPPLAPGLTASPPAPVVAGAGAHDGGGSPLPEDTTGNVSRPRKGILVGGDASGEVILQLTPGGNNADLKRPADRRFDDDAGAPVALLNGAANSVNHASVRDAGSPGSPVVIEMGSMLRSGAATPAVSQPGAMSTSQHQPAHRLMGPPFATLPEQPPRDATHEPSGRPSAASSHRAPAEDQPSQMMPRSDMRPENHHHRGGDHDDDDDDDADDDRVAAKPRAAASPSTTPAGAAPSAEPRGNMAGPPRDDDERGDEEFDPIGGPPVVNEYSDVRDREDGAAGASGGVVPPDVGSPAENDDDTSADRPAERRNAGKGGKRRNRKRDDDAACCGGGCVVC